ncbi:MAG: methylenetetrahydrofolate reductase [Miltoncostaeaceae bacterium]
MRIPDLIAGGPTWSVEFFPPKTPEAEVQFRAAVEELAPLRPDFASVTYGALGTTRSTTRDIVVRMNADLSFPTMAHLTCVGHTRAEIDELLDGYAAEGVQNILALGGDPPADGSDPGGEFSYAEELVEVIRAHPAEFAIGVAAHPEVHPRSDDRDGDRRHLARKLMAADFAITQFFFDVEHYFRMVDELGALGCDRPVVAGVMPFTSGPGLIRMAQMNRCVLPDGLAERLETAGADEIADLGVEMATTICETLVAGGAPGIHLYTLNRGASVHRVHDNLPDLTAVARRSG